MLKHIDMFRCRLSFIIALSALVLFSLETSAQITPERRSYVETISVPNHPDRIYEVGEEAVVRVEAYAGGLPLEGEWLHYSAGDELMKPDMKDSVRFSNGIALVPMGTRSEPGFRSLNYEFSVAGNEYKDYVVVGFSPHLLKPLTPMPDDFDLFWEKALKEAEAVDIAPIESKPLPQYSTDKVIVTQVKLTVGPGGRNIYAYLSKPAAEGRYPVLFEPPGAGIHKRKPSTFYAEQGYIYMNISIHHDADSELPDDEYAAVVAPYEHYRRDGIEAPETFYYRQVYAACSRCIDYLCSLPEWDGKNVGVVGGSQGGALSIVSAVLNPKVTFCTAFYPALCDLLGALDGRAPGWPKYYLYRDEAEGTKRTVAYYDVANFAKKLTCPVFYSFGFNDTTCCPTSTYAVYNIITAPKKLVATRTNGHWRFNATNREALEWMNSQLVD